MSEEDIEELATTLSLYGGIDLGPAWTGFRSVTVSPTARRLPTFLICTGPIDLDDMGNRIISCEYCREQ